MVEYFCLKSNWILYTCLSSFKAFTCLKSIIELLEQGVKYVFIVSSIMNEVIRGNFRLLFFFFFHDKILQAQKAYKQTKLKKTSKERVTYSLIYVLCFLCS